MTDAGDAVKPAAVKPVADTGYLLCFGAIPKGTGLLAELHPSGVAAPDAVHRELDGLARSTRADEADAAGAFAGRKRLQIEKVPFNKDDEALRSKVRQELHDADVARGRASGARPSGNKHSGEAECICLCLRTGAEMLCNDTGARAAAHARSVKTVTTAADLRRLAGSAYTAQQLYQLARAMEQAGRDLGAVVTGPAFFRG